MPATDQHTLMAAIDDSFGFLSLIEDRVVRMSFGLGEAEQTDEEIANRLGIAIEQVDGIRRQAARKLKHPALAKLFGAIQEAG